MSQDLHISELIERYLGGEMLPEEQVSFEHKMAGDSNLASMVEETRLTNEALHFANLAVLKEGIGKDIKNIPHRPNSGIKKTVLVSASLLLAGTLAYVLTTANEPETHSKTNTAVEKKQETLKTTRQADYERKNIEEVKTVPPSNSKEITPTEEKKKETEVDIVNTKATEPEEKPVPSTITTLQKPEEKEVNPQEEKENTQQPVAVEKDSIPAKTEKTVLPCHRSFEISSTASCKEEANGVVTVHLDNTEDYQFELEGYNGSQVVGNQFYNVAAGEYQMVIKYAACTFKKPVTVSEKWCGSNKSFSFNPEYGERWEIMYAAGEEGTFVIYNARGREVYTANFGNGSEYWDGKDLSGNPAPVGSYFALIKYSNNHVERVELTIVR